MLYVYFYKIKMDSFEINKIIAAILVTLLVVFGIGKISDIVYHVEKPCFDRVLSRVRLPSVGV